MNEAQVKAMLDAVAKDEFPQGIVEAGVFALHMTMGFSLEQAPPEDGVTAAFKAMLTAWAARQP